MRKCPFCGAEVDIEFPYCLYLDNVNKWGFLHHCNNKKCVLITAETKEEIIAEWNESYEEPTSESM